MHPLARRYARCGVTDELPDIIAPHLNVLFCGINPGLTAAATGHHFAGRGNRFWRVFHLAGFTPEEISPEFDRSLLGYGCGVTAVVKRPTASADQLSRAEFVAAAAEFEHKIARYAPRFVAFLGKAAYAALASQREIAWGSQRARMSGAAIWVLPNPSGRNRAFALDSLVDAYRQLYAACVREQR
jgi:double-stranded uracil-DNA glycosylase